MKNKKILIIGFGNMGLAHLKSFTKMNNIIYLFDKKVTKIKTLLKKNNIKDINKLKILKRIPKDEKFDLCIVSTKSLERFNIFKKFLSLNKCKLIFLEKFSFINKKHFDYTSKIFNLKNIYVNSWGLYLANHIKIKNKTNFSMNIEIENQRCLPNITHILHFFFSLDGYSKIHSKEKKIKIVKLKKDEKYDEIKGFFSIKTKNKNQLILRTTNNIKYDFNFDIINKNNKYKIFFKDNKIHIKKNFTKKIIDFPFSSKTSKNILKVNRNDYFPNLEKDKIVSFFVLNYLSKKII